MPSHLGIAIRRVKSLNMMLKATEMRSWPLVFCGTECPSQAGKITRRPAGALTKAWGAFIGPCFFTRGEIWWICGRGSTKRTESAPGPVFT